MKEITDFHGKENQWVLRYTYSYFKDKVVLVLVCTLIYIFFLNTRSLQENVTNTSGSGTTVLHVLIKNMKKDDKTMWLVIKNTSQGF